MGGKTALQKLLEGKTEERTQNWAADWKKKRPVSVSITEITYNCN